MRPIVAPKITGSSETTSPPRGGSEVVTVTTPTGNQPVSDCNLPSAMVVQTTSEPLHICRWLRGGNAQKTAIYHPTVTTSLSSRERVGRVQQPPLRAPVRARAGVVVFRGGRNMAESQICSETSHARKLGGVGLCVAALTLLAGCGQRATCTSVATGEVRSGYAVGSNDGREGYVVRDSNGIEGTVDNSNSADWRCRVTK